MLSRDERRRYDRQMILPEFGEDGQVALKKSSVLVIGAGGLGCPVLTYLTAAGVGTIGVVDDDYVDASNLHRQVLFNLEDVGSLKVEVAARKLSKQNPLINIVSLPIRLTSENAMELIDGYDIVVDGSDNFPTRYLVNDACVLLGKPLVYGAIHQYEGQVSVFNYLEKNGSRGPNYRDLFPTPPPPDQIPNCAEAGVLGILPGIIGSLQANEVIKIILNQHVLNGQLLIFDAKTSKSLTIKLGKNPENPLSEKNKTTFELVDYDLFCGIESKLTEITSKEFLALRRGQKKITVIDVREVHEVEIHPFEAQHIPLSSFEEKLDEISDLYDVVFVCRSGRRSLKALQYWNEAHPTSVAYSLSGGVEGLSRFL